MDIEEEFEFKPLTEGLGFHKKEVKLKEERKKADDYQIKMSKALTDAEDLKKVEPPKDSSEDVKKLVQNFPNLDTNFVEKKENQVIASTLPRDDLNTRQIEPKDLLEDNSDMDLKVDPEIFNRKIGIVPEMKPLIDQTEEKVKIEKKLVEKVEPCPPSLWAYVIDALTIVGLTNVFLAALLLVTKVDVVYVLSHPQSDVLTKVSLITLLASVCLFYLLVARVFFKKTLGEWAMDMQMGSDKDSLKITYPIQLSLRFLVNIFSGVILLPLISLIFRKDVLGLITGVKSHKRFMKWE